MIFSLISDILNEFLIFSIPSLIFIFNTFAFSLIFVVFFISLIIASLILSRLTFNLTKESVKLIWPILFLISFLILFLISGLFNNKYWIASTIWASLIFLNAESIVFKYGSIFG